MYDLRKSEIGDRAVFFGAWHAEILLIVLGCEGFSAEHLFWQHALGSI